MRRLYEDEDEDENKPIIGYDESARCFTFGQLDGERATGTISDPNFRTDTVHLTFEGWRNCGSPHPGCISEGAQGSCDVYVDHESLYGGVSCKPEIEEDTFEVWVDGEIFNAKNKQEDDYPGLYEAYLEDVKSLICEKYMGRIFYGHADVDSRLENNSIATRLANCTMKYRRDDGWW